MSQILKKLDQVETEAPEIEIELELAQEEPKHLRVIEPIVPEPTFSESIVPEPVVSELSAPASPSEPVVPTPSVDEEAPRRIAGWGAVVFALVAGFGAWKVLRPNATTPIAGAQTDAKVSPFQRFEEAHELLSRDQASLAVGAFESLKAEYPRNTAVLLGLAKSLELTQAPDRAEKTLREALALEPKNAVVLNNLGIFLVRQGSHQKGLTYLEAAEELDADLAEPLLNEGRAYELLHRWRDAIDAYEAYLLHEKRESRWIQPLETRLKKLEPLAQSQEQQEEKE